MKSIAIVLATAVSLLPMLAFAGDAKKPAAAKATAQMPASPLSEKELKDALKALGPKGAKVKLPVFKKNATPAQKAAKIKRFDRLISKVKAYKKTPAHLQAGVRAWEALSPGQKEALFSSDGIADPTVTGWVGVAIAVVAFAYYVADTQDYVGDDPPKDKETGGEDEPAEPDGGDDGGDTGFHTLDY